MAANFCEYLDGFEEANKKTTKFCRRRNIFDEFTLTHLLTKKKPKKLRLTKKKKAKELTELTMSKIRVCVLRFITHIFAYEKCKFQHLLYFSRANLGNKGGEKR